MKTKKTLRVILVGDAKQSYEELKDLLKQEEKETTFNSFHRTLYNSIERAIKNIKVDPAFGRPISKKKIPRVYRNKYGITNAFWVSLSSGWRMIYSLTGEKDQAEIICIVLDYFNHKGYSKKFNYKNN